MKDQKEKAAEFARLHVKGDPVILFNIWDAGSAKAVAEAGAQAVATGSWSVAAAYGYGDGEEMPMDAAIENLRRITACVDLPVSLDFEGGYAPDGQGLKLNIEKVLAAGAVGINFEDQVVGGDGLHNIERQSERIAALREAAENSSVPLFINARTDIFLKADPAEHTADQLDEAVARAVAYAGAGASGFFAAGLRDPLLIRELCERSPLPVNILVMPGVPANKELARLGVARISYGAGPYRQMIAALKEAGRAAFTSVSGHDI